MTDFQPVLLANIDKPESHTLRAYEATGGYQGYKKTLSSMQPNDVKELIKLRTVYEHLETVTDCCEDVANIIQSIVIEND